MDTDRKSENFNKFKAVSGITFVIALLIAFVNLLSAENANIQIHDVALKTRMSAIARQ